MKIIAISDFHGKLPKINPGDLLLISGDISPFSIQDKFVEMTDWMESEFKDWINQLPVNKVILTPGNHDFIFEQWTTEQIKRYESLFYDKLTILINEPYNYLGVSIFGTPYCHMFGYWPFMKYDSLLEDAFKEIPENIDILITHDPPHGISNCDVILKPRFPSQAHYKHIGDEPLTKRIIELNNLAPKYILCGHIHSGEHNFEDFNNSKIANVSLMDEGCDELIYKPLEFEYGNIN